MLGRRNPMPQLLLLLSGFQESGRIQPAPNILHGIDGFQNPIPLRASNILLEGYSKEIGPSPIFIPLGYRALIKDRLENLIHRIARSLVPVKIYTLVDELNLSLVVQITFPSLPDVHMHFPSQHV